MNVVDTLKNMFGLNEEDHKANRWTFGVILGAALVGFLASFILSAEYVELLNNPNANLPCNINAVLNCASVMKTEQSHVFGFPNSFLGIAGYAVLVTMAISYFAGGRFKAWYYLLANFCIFLGLIFAYWLFFQSVYVIQILCPWCLFVTVCTTLIFEAMLRFNLRNNHFNFPSKVHGRITKFLQKDYDKFVTAGWLVLLTGLVFLQFPDIFG